MIKDYSDDFKRLEAQLARLIQLEESRQPPVMPVIPDYTKELKEIRKLLEQHNVVYGKVLNRTSGTYVQPSGNPVNFETDQALGTAPTYYIEIEPRDADGNLEIQEFKLQHVRYLFNCTNAVTYELYLFESNIGASYDQKAACVFDSGATKADNTMYIDTGANMLPLNIKLQEKGKLYYSIDWSAAPGNTAGYIVVMGEKIK